MKKKRHPFIVPILWVFVTAAWIVTVCISISSGDTQGFLFILKCANVLVSGGAAVSNYIRHKRSKNDEIEE